MGFAFNVFLFFLKYKWISVIDHCLARDEMNNPSASLTNGDSHRRLINTNRQHLTDTSRRTTKPKNISMTQSVHIGTSSNGLPLSRSSHQIRMPTPPVASTRRVYLNLSSILFNINVLFCF